MLERTERKTKVKKVDMQMVQTLLIWQKECNNALNGTKYSCTLHPKQCEPCSFCLHYKECSFYEWERDYIYKHSQSKKCAKIREKKNGKMIEKNHTSCSNEGDEPVYPCEPFDFCCPDRESCQEGMFCTWKEE